jgi:hypothetical protein
MSERLKLALVGVLVVRSARHNSTPERTMVFVTPMVVAVRIEILNQFTWLLVYAEEEVVLLVPR